MKFNKELSHILDIIQQELEKEKNPVKIKMLKWFKSLIEKYIP